MSPTLRTERLPSYSQLPINFVRMLAVYRYSPPDLYQLTLRRLFLGASGPMSDLSETSKMIRNAYDGPLGVWISTAIALLVISYVSLFSRHRKTRLLPTLFLPSIAVQCVTATSALRSEQEEFQNQAKTGMWLIVGLMLSVLSNYICLLFNIVRMPDLPIHSFKGSVNPLRFFPLHSGSRKILADMMEEAASGRMRIVFDRRLHQGQLHTWAKILTPNLYHKVSSAVHRSSRAVLCCQVVVLQMLLENPPILNDSAADWVGKGEEMNDKPLVLFGSTAAVATIRALRSYCGLTSMQPSGA